MDEAATPESDIIERNHRKHAVDCKMPRIELSAFRESG
jgi:hypothetical protein